MFRQSLKVVLTPFGAALLFLTVVSIGAAQPPRPLPEDQVERQPATPTAAPEPGYLGLITDDRRDQGMGVRVVKVVEGSPAADAGFEVGDLIVAIDGKRVGSLDEMAAQLEKHATGDKAHFEIRRGGASKEIDATLGRRPPRGERPFEFGRIPEGLPETPSRGAAAPAGVGPLPGPAPQDLAAPRGQLLGIRTGPVSEEARARLGMREARGALVVSRVVGSPADKAGIPLDAVIVALDGEAVASPTDLARLIAAAGPGKEVELTFYSRGEERKAAVTLEKVGGLPPLPDNPPVSGPREIPRPFDRQIAPPPGAGERIEQLERRIRELEQRVQELERSLRRNT